MLVNKVPTVLRIDLYAVAALVGAIVVVIGHLLRLPPNETALVGAAFCFSIRLSTMYYGCQVPRARPSITEVRSGEVRR